MGRERNDERNAARRGTGSATRKTMPALALLVFAFAGCQSTERVEALERENARLRAQLQEQEQEQDSERVAPRSRPRSPAVDTEGWARHVVRNRESLSSIAERHYGDPSYWEEIHEANRELIGDDPGRLEVGTTLVLPPRR